MISARKVKILSGLSELSTFIKTILDSHEGRLKERYESELNENIQPLIQRYQAVKDTTFENNQRVEDLYARINLFISTQAKLH